MKRPSFVLMVAVIMGGCSVYHDARDALPADTRERLSLRLTEARAAEQAAVECASKLAVEHGIGESEEVDRLDLRARELDRRVLSAEDVSTTLAEPDRADVRRLRVRADQLLEAVRAIKANDASGRQLLTQWLNESTGNEKGRG
jgi:hypothetical protein